MQQVELRPDVEGGTPRLADGAEERLALWLQYEIEAALSSRSNLEREWELALAAYEAVPERKVVTFPFEGAANGVVPLGAIACESIYAQSLELIFSVDPVVTVQPLDQRYVAQAKALQRFVNWMTANECGLSAASRQTILDDVQLGTGIYYVPWVRETRKGRVAQVVREGPRVVSVDPIDFLVPPSSTEDLQRTKWCALRFWLDEAAVNARAESEMWRKERRERARGGAQLSNMRLKRERLGHEAQGQAAKSAGELFELWDVYCAFDVDGDGIEEDLLVTWDRVSGGVLHLRYNPYDRRPFEIMRYQERAHLFYGLGVLEMLRAFQCEVTDQHRWRNDNARLANCRVWAARQGSVPVSLVMYPGKVLQLQDPKDVVPLAMADVYPSAVQNETITLSLAERRTGINELSLPSRSAMMGNRTPGITAISLIQATNRRFTSVFDGLRAATGGAVKQALFRYQERLLEGSGSIERHIERVLGFEDAALVVDVLRDQQFDDAMKVELTTSSASVSKEADRQSALMLMNMLAQYYQRVLELIGVNSNLQVPEPVRKAAGEIAKAASAIVERVVRTFDQVRDPSTFVLDVARLLEEGEGAGGLGDGGVGAVAGNPAGAFGGLAQLLGISAPATGGNGAASDAEQGLAGVSAGAGGMESA